MRDTLKLSIRRLNSIIKHGKAMGWDTERLEIAYRENLRQLAKRIYGNRYGWLFNKSAFWLGVHYSPYNRRYCINLVPCITFWFTLKCGKAPKRSKM